MNVEYLNRAIVTGQIRRFEQWRQRLNGHAALLVNLVLEEIVPQFISRGFDRFPDYAGDNSMAIGANCIPLQRRSGSNGQQRSVSTAGRARSLVLRLLVCQRSASAALAGRQSKFNESKQMWWKARPLFCSARARAKTMIVALDITGSRFVPGPR